MKQLLLFFLCSFILIAQIQIGQDIDGEAAGNRFGGSVSISGNGNVVAIGARLNAGNGNNSGHVRVFDLSAILSLYEFVLKNFRLYPNPTREQFTIDLNSTFQLEQINIYNSLGQYLFSSEEIIVDTSSLSIGLYLVEIKTDQGKATKKLVIE